MFDNLEERLGAILKKVRGRGTLNEDNIKDALREVRLALLEADVHFSVVKWFVERVRERAMGQAVSASLTPGQEFIRIVSEELSEMMGGQAATLDLRDKPPIVLLLMGLQGSGKTTTAAKLAKWMKAQRRTVMLVPADIYRPAAIQQLKTLAAKVEVDVYDSQPQQKPEDIVKAALAQAERQGQEVLIVDTAGRLQIDLELMEELRQLREISQPKYSILVVDAMTGQDAVNVATEFRAQVGVDGVIMTKLDGDARGGAALSVRRVTGAPIYFAGMGEKLDLLEIFHPDRIAQRILGMGDVMSLIEKTATAYDAGKAEKLAKKMKKAEFTLEDFKEQMQMVQQMGDLKGLLGMIPGVSQAMKKMGASGPDPEREMKRLTAIVDSMTLKERRNPDVLNGARRKRIALGSGTTVPEVNAFLKRFKDAQKMMKKFSKMGMGGLKEMMRGMRG